MAPIIELSDNVLKMLSPNSYTRRTDLEGSLAKSVSEIIIQPDNFWTIENVVNPRTGEKRNYLLLKEMLPAMDYAQMTAHYIRAIAKGEFHAEDMPTNYAVMKTIRNSNHPDKEKIRKFWQRSMRATLPTALTQAVHDKKEKFVHKEGIPNEEYEMKCRIWGLDRIIDAKGDSKMFNGLVLTNDVEEIRDVLNWVNETPVYIFRKNKKSYSKDKIVARFDANSVRVDFSIGRDPAIQYSSFGYK